MRVRTEYWALHATLTAVLALGAAQPVFAQVGLDALTESGLVRAGPATGVFVSPGFEDRGASLAIPWSGVVSCVAAEFLPDLEVTLAVADEKAWTRLAEYPYGVPWMTDSVPWIVMLPADPERGHIAGVLSQRVDRAAAAAFADALGFHEIAHAALFQNNEGADRAPVRWLHELLAIYITYGCLDQVEGGLASVWANVSTVATQGAQPRYRSLDDFEARYADYLMATTDGGQNFGWYQAVFVEWASTAWRRAGFELVHGVRSLLWVNPDGRPEMEKIIRALDAFAPGFKSWSERLSSR